MTEYKDKQPVRFVKPYHNFLTPDVDVFIRSGARGTIYKPPDEDSPDAALVKVRGIDGVLLVHLDEIEPIEDSNVEEQE